MITNKVLALALCLGVAHAVQADVVGHWSFDSDYTDVSGNGLNGTLNDVGTIGNSGITTTAGEYVFGGGAMNFSADKDSIDLTPQIMATDANGFAFAFWAKDRNAVLDQDGMVLGDRGNTTDFFWVDNNFGGARWRSNSSTYTADFATGAEDTLWHHWAVVVTGADVTVYQDGSFFSTVAGEAGTDFNFATIGEAYSSTIHNYDYDGQIDEVWLF
ncbi:MAG: hypothetical protein KAU94_00815, partial [Verrucomicrobia bacterium]|nr:hypothetical protein [Verrucomicrobiota bacterium]